MEVCVCIISLSSKEIDGGETAANFFGGFGNSRLLPNHMARSHAGELTTSVANPARARPVAGTLSRTTGGADTRRNSCVQAPSLALSGTFLRLPRRKMNFTARGDRPRRRLNHTIAGKTEPCCALSCTGAHKSPGGPQAPYARNRVDREGGNDKIFTFAGTQRGGRVLPRCGTTLGKGIIGEDYNSRVFRYRAGKRIFTIGSRSSPVRGAGRRRGDGRSASPATAARLRSTAGTLIR